MKYPGLVIEGTKFKAELKAIKLRLNELGFGTFDPSNPNFGPSTKQAVKDFQKSKNLLDDGKVGELTWERLFEDPLKKIVIPASNIAERAKQIMLTQLHVREKTGKNDGEEVEKYLKSIGLGKGYAWCMAVVYWAYEQAAKELAIDNPLIKTGGVLKQLNLIDPKYKKDKPQTNDIFIMDFGGGTGHAGIITNVVGNRVHTVEGNTSSDPSLPAEDREGNGMFERSRKSSSMKAYIRIS